jgi:hypothetical protein
MVDRHGDLRGQLHSDGLPRLIVGLDADAEVPDLLPIDAIAATLERSWNRRHHNPASTAKRQRRAQHLLARARRIWVDGVRLPCLGRRSARLHRTHEYNTEYHLSSTLLPRHGTCDEPPPDAYPVFVSPPAGRISDTRYNLSLTTWACKWPAATHMPHGACGGCSGTPTPPLQLKPLQKAAGNAAQLEGRLYRGPFCPSSQFFIVHRYELKRVLASFDLWHDAFEAGAARWEPLALSWETTTCALLDEDEASLAVLFPWANLPSPPTRWVQQCLRSARDVSQPVSRWS